MSPPTGLAPALLQGRRRHDRLATACTCLRPGCLHYGGLLRRPPDVLHTLLASLRATRAAAAELRNSLPPRSLPSQPTLPLLLPFPSPVLAVVPGNPLDDVKLLVGTVASLLRGNALRSGKGVNVSFGSKSNEEKVIVG